MKKVAIKGLIIFFIINCSASFLKAQNPIIRDFGMADPHIKIYNNKVYLYTTRDADKTAQKFVMPDWHIWSSDDLVNWKHELTIKPTETYMGESNDCWATDVAFKNGKYYLYFSNKNINTGVMVSNSPTGPFKDVLGKPMLDLDLTSTKEYDPTVLIDDDKDSSAYIVFGHYRADDPNLNWHIAKLNEDMISLSEKPKEIKITGDVDVLKGNDKPNLHKRDGIYYLSAGSHYATSKNIYGPYTRIGNSGNDDYGLTARAHGNYFEWNNQWFHTWCHFHLGKEVARYRESYITYLHYKDNGEMVSDVGYFDAHFETGVGQYDASWEKIEAEWYMAANNVQKKESPNGGFEISNIKNGGSLYYPNMDNMDKTNSISFFISSKKHGVIEIYDDNEKGTLLGSCKIPGTGDWNSYMKVTCNLQNVKGVKNIYLKFSGKSDDLLHLDWFQFNYKQ